MTENNGMIEEQNQTTDGYRPPFDILYEDNHLIVVLKKQMTACCPDESKDDNLLDQVKQYIKNVLNWLLSIGRAETTG